MDIIILAGGLGTRLKSVIGDNPKCLAPVNGKPFIHILIDKYRVYGFKRFIISIGYQKDKVIKSLKSKTGCEIIFCVEDEPLGTGGAIKKARNYTNSNNVIVLNGDSLIELDYKHLIDWHFKMKSNCTIVSTIVPNANRYGTIKIDKKNRIIDFKEKQKISQKGLINAGVYIFNKSIFNLMPDENSFSMEIEFLPKILGEKVYGYISKEKLIDIGTPESYRQAIKNYR